MNEKQFKENYPALAEATMIEKQFAEKYPALSQVYFRVFDKPCDYRQPAEKTDSREIYSATE